MENFEFINYMPTPHETYFAGIATVRIYGKIILKYKIVIKKDGSGYFVAAPNYRLPAEKEGAYKYIDAFSIDSMIENDQLRSYIRQNVNQHMNNQGKQQQTHQTNTITECPF